MIVALALAFQFSLADSVRVIAQATDQRGLPGRVLIDKMNEGLSKHVPPPRILAAVRDLAQRLERARSDLRSGGVQRMGPATIAGAADASVQGIARADQVDIVQAAPNDSAAGSGLSVAAALVVQGLDPGISARLVAQSFTSGRTLTQVLDLPAAARALQVQGVSSTEVGRQLLSGIGVTVRPAVPPVRIP